MKLPYQASAIERKTGRTPAVDLSAAVGPSGFLDILKDLKLPGTGTGIAPPPYFGGWGLGGG